MSGLVLRKKVTTLDKIRKYYLKGEESVKLSDKQEEIRIRVYKSWNLLCNYHSKEQAMSVIMREYSPLSRAQAYRYVSDAMSIFGNPIENSKEAKRYLIEEDLMRLQQKAIKSNDGDLELRVLAQRIKLGNYNQDDSAKVDPNKLVAQVYVIKTSESVMNTINSHKEAGVVDFNMMDTEDIDYKEVKEQEDEDE